MTKAWLSIKLWAGSILFSSILLFVLLLPEGGISILLSFIIFPISSLILSFPLIIGIRIGIGLAARIPYSNHSSLAWMIFQMWLQAFLSIHLLARIVNVTTNEIIYIYVAVLGGILIEAVLLRSSIYSVFNKSEIHEQSEIFNGKEAS